MKQGGERVYDHETIEVRWQKFWQQIKLNELDTAGAEKPFYNLMMFPYPSAEGLHVGNMYAFTGSDIYGRFKRMQGYSVFEPIGLDGFGIHSENYALKIGRHPMDQAQIAEKKFYAQLHKIGAMFDWSRTVETYDPGYYQWTQWLFTQMFRHGLAYRAKASVNWCPSDKTVLADEQVIDGKCERCGNIVEKRLLEQWFFRITAYAEKLLKNSFDLDWSEKVRIAQQNWIGKKEGIEITYKVVDDKENEAGKVVCFTTRPDTNFGATFVVLAPEHPLITHLMKVIKNEQIVKIRQYLEKIKKKSEQERLLDREKTGVFTGLYCINNLNGDKMPLYISDFVLMEFGTGAVVGVPGHDTRDFEFAKVFDLPIKRVVVGKDGDRSPISHIDQVQEDEGTMMNSQFLDDLEIHEATKKIMDYLEQKGWGKRVTSYHLRDWLISRQRYWGPPIPMIFCASCEKNNKGERTDMPGWWTVPDEKLPVALPHIEDYRPGDDGVAPLAKHKDFYEVACPACGSPARRETDVSDTFLDSSWYFLRYPSVGANPKSKTQNSNQIQSELPWDPQVTRRWLPVSMYTGGAEHSVLHLMYSRFVTLALHDWGYIDFAEPFARFYAHGLVIKNGAKMSKSKGNVVNPDEYIKLYGADALRLYLMFIGPYDQGGDFRDSSMEGMSRWMRRVWRMYQAENGEKTTNSDVKRALHRLVMKVTDDIEKRRYNTAIASMMEFTNLVADAGGGLSREDGKTFLLLLAPFAPHIAEELWFQLTSQNEKRYQNIKDSIHCQPWPLYDPTMVKNETVAVVVQINGKVRETIVLPQEEAKNREIVAGKARESKKVEKHLEGQNVKNVIFVPERIINFVTV